MKWMSGFPTIVLFIFLFGTSYGQKIYPLISKKTGKINTKVVSSLSPSLRGLAAYYSAVGGTDCIEMTCQLTKALGLGDQGSEEQKKLIQTYFPGDNAAKLVLGQNCYLPSSTSSSFSNFKSLDFTVKGDSVIVNYQLLVYERGRSTTISGPDVFTFKSQVFKNRKRVLYAWTDKK